ncbi:MAG: hypothetical protein V9H25_01820 [Candidatus Competibacter sp.]
MDGRPEAAMNSRPLVRHHFGCPVWSSRDWIGETFAGNAESRGCLAIASGTVILESDVLYQVLDNRLFFGVHVSKIKANIVVVSVGITVASDNFYLNVKFLLVAGP